MFADTFSIGWWIMGGQYSMLSKNVTEITRQKKQHDLYDASSFRTLFSV